MGFSLLSDTLPIGPSPRQKIPEERSCPIRGLRNNGRGQTQAQIAYVTDKQDEKFCRAFQRPTLQENQHLDGVLVFWGCHIDCVA